MTKGSYADRRDSNEGEIIAWFRERGCRVIQMARSAGYDLQVFVPGGYAFPPIEVKNPRYHWDYTDDERELMVWCHDNGVEYITVTSIEDAEREWGRVH